MLKHVIFVIILLFSFSLMYMSYINQNLAEKQKQTKIEREMFVYQSDLHFEETQKQLKENLQAFTESSERLKQLHDNLS